MHQIGNPNAVTTIHEPIGSVPTVHLSYHLGRHYNSVRREDDPMMRGVAPITGLYVVGHDLVKNKALMNRIRPSRAELKKFKEDSKKVYKESVVRNMVEQIHDYFGFLLPGEQGRDKREMISERASIIHSNIETFDRNGTL